jgi:hypothetical protein
MIRIALIIAIAAMLALAAIAVAQAPQPASVTGTIVAMRPSESSPAEIDLRVESAEAKDLQARVGQAIAVGIRGVAANWHVIGLGDQVRVQIERGADDALTATGSVERLGRGEFVNPGRNPSRDLGSPNAKVLVKLLAPLQADCHRQTADLLQGIASEMPDKVRVQIFDVTEPAAREEMNRERLTCATVLVNNRYQFTLNQNGRKRAVELIHRPNTPESTYNSEDALAVVQQEIERLYPGDAPGGANSRGTYTPPKNA